ncbi:TetR/AcrR family transcriptional regulator [Ruminococcus sp. OA3]|uniref:TetR/AcrR family transcriptional regulator n=1 Tax=Ruminococcus sp. OA3 TaxID=2914164 RepID=UPI001F05C828|nr:TetR/AcrR family transcriptional regulator [Ruminococcus sp. OA3]MCH1984293.1 TetR/AcrR family transcriptional regulator [Ruminococcus sp. OA3]
MKSEHLFLPPKKQAVFKAVIAFLDKGLAPDSLKVSEIAAEAGIGKGTVYEYFSSKEEIITQTLVYELEMTAEEIQVMIQSAGSFEEVIRKLLDWIEENYERKTSFMRLLQLMERMDELPESIRRELKRQGHSPCDINHYLLRLAKRGQETEELSADIPCSMLASSILAALVMYLSYLNFPDGYGRMERESAKDYVWESIRAICGKKP